MHSKWKIDTYLRDMPTNKEKEGEKEREKPLSTKNTKKQKQTIPVASIQFNITHELQRHSYAQQMAKNTPQSQCNRSPPNIEKDSAYYVSLLKIKDRKIAQLTLLNNRLLKENKSLLHEKSESDIIMKEFAHTMGTIIQSLLTQIQKGSMHLQEANRASMSTSTSEFAQTEKALKDLNNEIQMNLKRKHAIHETPTITPKHASISNESAHSVRKSLASLLLERTETAAMVQSVLNEIQDLVE